MDNGSIELLTILLVVAVVGIIIMFFFVAYYIMKPKIPAKKPTTNVAETKKGGKRKRTYTIGSVMNFMEFDTIVDSMIVQMGGKKFVMVIECQGINYDLMSEEEKNGVEEGFIQFLNTLRHPIQIYTQTRSVNLTKSIEGYKKKVNEVQSQFERESLKYNQMRSAGAFSERQMKDEYFELTREKNLLEYGRDIIFETEKMSLNKSILNRKYYVVIPFYTEDLGEAKYDKNEKQNLAFTELYTKAQSIISTLAVCGVAGRILSSEELVDLLYMAYNRDEAETYGIERALEAGYDALYSTAPDVTEKQLKLLDEQIQREAVQTATRAVDAARSDIQRELDKRRMTKDQLIEEMAQYIISTNSTVIGEDVAERAEKKVDAQKEERLAKEAQEKAEAQAKAIEEAKKTPIAHAAPVPTATQVNQQKAPQAPEQEVQAFEPPPAPTIAPAQVVTPPQQ